MSKSKPSLTLTDVLKAAIERSGLTVYRIGKATGIDAANLGRFVRGELSIRLDKADRLGAYLGLRLTPDPDAVPPEPTPENLARPTLAKRRAKRKAK
jgi:transcriptional regulator with XRE-family HTH domain